MTSRSLEETESVAADLAARLTIGDVVAVRGELGAGKTTFVRGACRALGVAGVVTSPTYVVGNRYRGSVAVAHVDLYRFDGMSHAEWGDLEPLFDDAVGFVEWPEAGRGLLPDPAFDVTIEHVDPATRRISIETASDCSRSSVKRQR